MLLVLILGGMRCDKRGILQVVKGPGTAGLRLNSAVVWKVKFVSNVVNPSRDSKQAVSGSMIPMILHGQSNSV